jgi:GR25 family glycosyltransferase involved in LPS biosynthesis
MRHYDELLREQRGPFTVVVDKTWEDLDPRGQFEDSDIEEICRKINDDTYDWFMLRTRVFFQDVELAANYLGGCLYEDAREVLTDGTAEDQIYSTLLEAKKPLIELKEQFAAVDPDAVDALVN